MSADVDKLSQNIAAFENEGALSDIKVLDFSWAAATPIATKNLADNGATVVRIESERHLDSVRITAPFPDDKPGVNRSGFFADFNSSKFGVSLDLTNDSARDIVRQLVLWADVVVESFTPRVLSGLKLDYENIVKWKPDIIMLSSCMQGQTGPYKDYAGYGIQGAAIAGLHNVTGWPDLEPAGPKGAYTDTIAPRYIVASILAALDYRDRTLKGQYIDLSQIEAAVSGFLTIEMLDYSTNGRVAERRGNRSRYLAPHGSFPCLGDDYWVTICVEDEDQWNSLCSAMGNPEWTKAEPFLTVQGRFTHQDELEALLSTWTSRQHAKDVVECLQRHKVPAGVVNKSVDLFEDPQLKHRNHFRSLNHVEMGALDYNGPAYLLSETPAELHWAAPLLGEHTEYVMKNILGLSDDEYSDLESKSVFY